MRPAQIEEILRLSVEDRIQLVEAIWDSIADNPDSIPLTQGQRQELDLRLAEHRRNPQAARPWSEIRDALNRRK